MTLSDLERRDPRGHIYQRDLFHYARTVWPRTTKFGKITRGEGCISKGQPRTHYNGRGSNAVHFRGFPSIYKHTPWRRTTKVDITHMGRGLVLRGQPRPSPKGRNPSFPVLGILLNLCIHPLTQNVRVRQGNTCREGRFLLASHASHPKGRAPQFLGSRLFIFTPFDV